MKIAYALLSVFWLSRDIWKLKELALKKGMNSPAGIAYRIRMRIYNSWIDPHAVFQGKPCFPHGISGIFVSGEATIGKDCVIFQQVTIGNNMLMDSSKKGSPTIGNMCYLGAGSKIIGKITIGDRCRVGANAVVVKDTPPNSTVVGMPEYRIIQHVEPLDNRFWRYKGSGIEYFEDGAFR